MKAPFALTALLALALPGCNQPSPRPPATPTSSASAPVSPTDITNAFARLNALQREAKSLPDLLAVYNFYLDHLNQSTGVTRDFVAQVLAATEAEMGAYPKAVLQFPQSTPQLRGTPAALPDPENFRAVDAADAIADLARGRRIVMINEAHHVGQTRLLTLALLPRLRALGFTHFAAEDLDERDTDLAMRGYPIDASGTYVREPLYGETIRTALRLGFVVVAYDSTGDKIDPDAREDDQANHLVERVFETSANARLFVHAGYAHVHKRPDYFFTATLAMRLRRMTGFDPLSIDQTVLRAVAPGREYADYRELLRRFPATGPTLFLRRETGSAWSLEPQVYDVSVVLPPATRSIDGRPEWLRLGGGRVPVSIDVDMRSMHLPCLMEAHYADESYVAVPADRLLLEHADDKPTMILRGGDYRIDTLCSSGENIGGRNLRVGG